jgi:DNA invertase Pin-like site-specific DNA recombinase
MDAAREPNAPNLLDEWMTRNRCKAPRAGFITKRRQGVRFAFYGRMSTVEYQDRASSRAWQREAADHLVVGHGAVVVEFFDEGCSRRLPWSSRPEVAALPAELSSPGRRFDAVVVGEYERACSGDEFAKVVALFERAGVQMWLPEAGGRWVREDPMAQALVMVLGAQSQREVLRSRHRVLAAMRAQARAAIWVGGRRTGIG